MASIALVAGAVAFSFSLDRSLLQAGAGGLLLAEVVARAGIDKAEVSETILGQVLTAGQGQNPARQAHIRAGDRGRAGPASAIVANSPSN